MANNYRSGFTLIELLVVVSIIGMLSSIVLAALNSSRMRANDTAVITEAIQFRNLLYQEYADIGSYSNLARNWVVTTDTVTSANSKSCPLPSAANAFAGNYRDKALEICQKMESLTSSLVGNRFFVGFPSSNNPSSFSIIVQMPSGGGKYLCLGNNGQKSIATVGSPVWINPGCWADPSNQ